MHIRFFNHWICFVVNAILLVHHVFRKSFEGQTATSTDFWVWFIGLIEHKIVLAYTNWNGCVKRKLFFINASYKSKLHFVQNQGTKTNRSYAKGIQTRSYPYDRSSLFFGTRSHLFVCYEVCQVVGRPRGGRFRGFHASTVRDDARRCDRVEYTFFLNRNTGRL